MKCSLGIKDPWYIKSLDMVPSAKNPEILEMRVEVDFLEGSKFSYNGSEELYPGREYGSTLTSSSTGATSRHGCLGSYSLKER